MSQISQASSASFARHVRNERSLTKQDLLGRYDATLGASSILDECSVYDEYSGAYV
jgi:hypothetical protein